MTDKRPIYLTKTFWGCIALFVASGLEGIGVTGVLGIVQQIATVIGLPLTAYGVADRLKK